MRKNILVSTTNGWNPGDDFIREGSLSLIKNKYNHNYLYWNRSPDSKKMFMNNLPNNMSLMDYFLVAGSPEWLNNNELVYNYCVKNNIKMTLIGIGLAQSDRLRSIILQSKKLIDTVICRDQSSYNYLKSMNIDAKILPCPASLSGKNIKRNKIKNISIGFMSINTKNTWSQDKKIFSKEYNKNFLKIVDYLKNKNYNINIICHYPADVVEAKTLFNNIDIYYSHNYRDYYKWYEESDIYIGSRVHGAILSLGYSSPAFLIGIDNRSEALKTYNDFFSDIEIKHIMGNDTTLFDKIKNWFEMTEKNYIDINNKIINNMNRLRDIYELEVKKMNNYINYK